MRNRPPSVVAVHGCARSSDTLGVGIGAVEGDVEGTVAHVIATDDAVIFDTLAGAHACAHGALFHIHDLHVTLRSDGFEISDMLDDIDVVVKLTVSEVQTLVFDEQILPAASNGRVADRGLVPRAATVPRGERADAPYDCDRTDRFALRSVDTDAVP